MPQLTNPSDYSVPNFIKRRCPNATEVELREAHVGFQAYLQLVQRILDRHQDEKLDESSNTLRPLD